MLHNPLGRSRRAARTGVVALALLALAPLAPAGAAATTAFDPNVPQVYASKSASQSDPTGLYKLSPNAAGTYSFTQVGADANLVYNALTYNTDDHFLYAISGDPLASGVPAGSLLKIGADGGYDVIGTGTFKEAGLQTNMGAYDTKTKEFWVLSAQGSTIYRINLDPDSAGYGTLIGTVTLDPANHDGQGGGSDLTYSGGAFWTLGRNGLFRINLDGSTDQFPVPAGAASSVGGDQAGAAWTFLNGDLGFSYNGSGEVIRIRVTNPLAASPTIATVVKSGGAASGQNDGAAIPGTVDLAIQKTGRLVDDGDTVSYTLTVTNNGGAASNGYSVTDTLPASLEDVEVGGDGTATVTGRTVTVTGDALAVGAKAVVTITATSPKTRPASIRNVAVVKGVDPDPVSSNNTDSVVLSYPPAEAPDPSDVAPAGAGVQSPDTGAPHQSGWLSYAAGALGLALLAGVALRLRGRRDEV